MVVTRKEVYAIVLFIAAVVVGAAYLHASMMGAAESQLKKDVAAQVASLRQDLATSLAAIARDKQTVKTPQQVIQAIPQYVTLPKPIILAGPQTTASDVPANLPNAPSASREQDGALYVPVEDVKPLFDHLADCKADSLKLQECSKELPLMEKRAEMAEKAMKGGGFFSRLKANTKFLVIGGSVTLGALCATGHCK